jgi:hypothetical protein
MESRMVQVLHNPGSQTDSACLLAAATAAPENDLPCAALVCVDRPRADESGVWTGGMGLAGR